MREKVRHQMFCRATPEELRQEYDGIGYMICQGLGAYVIYRVEVKGKKDRPEELVIAPAPNRIWPALYQPGIETKYKSHELCAMYRY
jgi:hypothetical protein